jgi:hypothetical protein
MEEQAGAELCQAEVKWTGQALKIQVVFHLQMNLRSSSIYEPIWGCLSFAKQLSSSSIYKTIGVVFHWTKI